MPPSSPTPDADPAPPGPASGPRHLRVPPAERGQRLDHVLERLVPDRTRAQLQKLVRRGKVKLEGRPVYRSNVTLRGGELIELREPDPGGNARRAAGPAECALTVLHEDEHLIVLDKPAGRLTHPTERLAGGTLAEDAVARFGPLPTVDGECRPGIVHRLDRDTSGVIVLARTEAALGHLRDQFRRSSVEKRYLALVYGNPSPARRRIDLSLGPIPGERDRQRVDAKGRPAVTDVEVRGAGGAISLVECRPRTGRRHQIRVHLAAIGHPVVGDPLYRPGPGVTRIPGQRHHLLHATHLTLRHPADGRAVTFRSPEPASFARLADQYG